jgi:phage regulator Rha-like protein
MNALLPAAVPATMSSREIAELTGKRHDHVLRDIEAQLTELLGAEGLPKFGDTYQNPQNGQTYRMYRLPKRECLIVVSGYSVELRARIIDRWLELESARPTELTREQILVMALESERERLRLDAENKALRPKAEFHDEVAQGEGEFTIRETVKTLFNRSISDNDLLTWMRRNGWVFRTSRELTAWAIDAGLMRLRHEYLPTVGKSVLTPVVTGKGITTLRHLIRTGELFTTCVSADRLLAAPARAV